MASEIKLKSDYQLANCCSPILQDEIIGYYSYNNILKVHKDGCDNLNKAEHDRLVSLKWEEIIITDEYKPDEKYHELDETDFKILKHHLEYDIDYSLMVAKMVQISKQDAFEKHKKLKELKLIERVDAVMVQYRKGVVDNKWIKHRNHTYYRLTTKGKKYTEFHFKSEE